MSRSKKTVADLAVPAWVVDPDAYTADVVAFVEDYKFRGGGPRTGVRKADMQRLYATAVAAVGGPEKAQPLGVMPVVREHAAAVCAAYGVKPDDVFSRPAARYHFTACERCTSDAAQHRVWKLLARVGRVLSADSWWEPDNPYGNSTGRVAPYTAVELDWFQRLAMTLPSDRRFAFEVAFWLPLAFAVDAEAIAFAHSNDFRPIVGGAWTFTPSTGPARTIPSPTEYGPKIAELVEARQGNYLLPTQSRTVASALAARSALRPRLVPSGTPTPTVARLASTWRWHRLQTGLNPHMITLLSGRQTMSWLNDMPTQATGLTLEQFELAQVSPTAEQLAIPFYEIGDAA